MLQDIFDTVEEPVIILDCNFVARLANRSFFKLFRTTEAEVIGKPFFELGNKQWDIEELRALLKDVLPRYKVVEHFVVTRKFPAIGERTMVLNAREVVAEHESSLIFIAIHDVTEMEENKKRLQKLQDQLIAAQRMESIALLAGGIAHDFNNVLGVIIGYAELALKKVGASHPLSENLTRITQAAQQGAQMVRQLLAFSRRQILSPQDININNLIEGLLKLLGKTLGEHIQLKFIPEEHIHTIHADPVQIEQIVMNLCLNARDAMPEGGQLIIETSNCQLDDEYCKTHAQVKPGDYIMMAVTDTGHGMSKAIQERIFEPFFTTKQPGKGTGLGLSVVHGIVTQHGGFINVYSEVGKGTTFKIYLPGVERPAVARKEMLKEEIPGGSETVLIVEDEAGMRDMMKAVLENLGYSVIAAEDGEQALHLISDNPHRIQLVISDIIVPKIGGKELFEELKSMNFEGQFLFISGYTSNAIHHNFITDKDVEALLKPFSPAELGKKVRALLDRVKR